MLVSYNPWLVALSIAVAVLVSYTALKLAGRIAADGDSKSSHWLGWGAISMGFGIWAMHFIGMLACSMETPLRYNIPTTFASLMIAMLTSGFALKIASRQDLKIRGLCAGALIMGSGVAAMHYSGMAAIAISPGIRYQPGLVALSVMIAIFASFVALWLTFTLRSGDSLKIKAARAGAALIMGLGISAMHYTGMAASMWAKGAYCTEGAVFDSGPLAAIIGLIALAVLTITVISTVYDAHLDSITHRDAVRLANLNAELAHGKKMLTLATEAAGIVCWELDVQSQQMSLWSNNEIAGLTEAGISLIANPQLLLTLVHPADDKAIRSQVKQTLIEGRELCSFQLRLMASADKPLYIQAHARLILNTEGRLATMLGVCWDESQRVHEEERRRSLQQQLREASRQAGMAEIATGVLHSVGNVLNSLGISAALVESGLRSSRAGNVTRVSELLQSQQAQLPQFFATDARAQHIPQYLQQLGEALAADNTKLHAEATSVVAKIQHIGTIVSAQQTYARLGGEAELTSVTELIETVLALNVGRAQEVNVIREFSAVPSLLLDRHKLIQILGNLLSNAQDAIKSTPHNQGRITVRVGRAEGSVLIEVIDSGQGISAETRARLFEFGFTTKVTGHGFGLHTSAILAKELGGNLTCFSEGLGHGATFTLRLPLGAADHETLRNAA